MHRTEGPDFEDFGGGVRRHKSAIPPETIISKDLMNALQEEVAGSIEEAGITLRTTGALDETGVWGQLKSAIKRLAGRAGNQGPAIFLPALAGGFDIGAFTTVVINADPFTIITGDINHGLILSESSPFPNSAVLLQEAGTWNQRIIWIFNATISDKIVLSAGLGYPGVRIKPFTLTAFFNIGGQWNALFVPRTFDELIDGSINKGYPRKRGSFPIEFRDGANAVIATTIAQWEKVNKMVNLSVLSTGGVATTAPGSIKLCGVGDTQFPVDIRCAVHQYFPGWKTPYPDINFWSLRQIGSMTNPDKIISGGSFPGPGFFEMFSHTFTYYTGDYSE